MERCLDKDFEDELLKLLIPQQNLRNQHLDR